MADKAGSSNEGDIVPLTTSVKDVTLWSRYKRVHDIVVAPIRPLVVLMGPPSCTAWVKKIIKEQTKIMR